MEVNDNKRSFLDRFGVLIYIVSIVVLCVVIILIVPRIELNGDIDILLSYNEEYKEPGYSAYVINQDISRKILVNNNINNGVIGDYQVNYLLDVIGLRFNKVRNVRIIDNISPVIEVSDEIINVCPKEEVNISYKAFDEYDGELTEKVDEVRSDNEIMLSVSDSSNNYTNKVIKVNREDKDGPVIKLKGSSSMFLEYGKSYKEPGYSAVDNCDGDLTKEVSFSGSVGRNFRFKRIRDQYEHSLRCFDRNGLWGGKTGRHLLYVAQSIGRRFHCFLQKSFGEAAVRRAFSATDSGITLTVAYVPQINEYLGMKTLQMNIKAVKI